MLTAESAPVSYCAASGGSCSVASATAACPSGTVVSGGGFRHLSGGGTSLSNTLAWSAPNGNGWGIIIVNNDDASGDEFVATARCISGPGARSARAVSNSGSMADALAEFNSAAR